MFAGLAVLQGIHGSDVKSSQARNQRCMTHPKPSDAATPVVSAFYDRFPFPGDPLQDGRHLDTTGVGVIAAFWPLCTARSLQGWRRRGSSMPVAEPG